MALRGACRAIPFDARLRRLPQAEARFADIDTRLPALSAHATITPVFLPAATLSASTCLMAALPCCFVFHDSFARRAMRCYAQRHAAHERHLY